MGIYTLRLIIHGLLLFVIMYITIGSEEYKLLLSNALVYILPFALDFNKHSLDSDYFPKRYTVGKYIVGITSFLILVAMLLNFQGLTLHVIPMVLFLLKGMFISIYLVIAFIVLLDWYFFKDTSDDFEKAEKAGRDSVREKQIAANERQQKRKLMQKNDYSEHVANISQKKTRKK
ncbi:hypothetical protein [Staphylococcus simulans]|uniref:Integral membrane protein n=3 Tax=Staphylococcus simulans TaxID=1286 RepID=A0ABN0PD99_STASI|nr:hypothetical protein [Staphylococcus simulans]ERS93581.1 hypothetical protein SSIM_05120 [Staphylococcus simulans UMC-CNS-990]